LRSSSQAKLPVQIKKSMEFNPVLGKYLDCKRDEEVLQMERKNSQEELTRSKVSMHLMYNTDSITR